MVHMQARCTKKHHLSQCNSANSWQTSIIWYSYVLWGLTSANLQISDSNKRQTRLDGSYNRNKTVNVPLKFSDIHRTTSNVILLFENSLSNLKLLWNSTQSLASKTHYMTALRFAEYGDHFSDVKKPRKWTVYYVWVNRNWVRWKSIIDGLNPLNRS